LNYEKVSNAPYREGKMPDLQEVATVDDMQSGAMKMVNIGGHEYLLAKVENKYYAADNRCPHMGGNLSLGKLEGTIVTCPLHGSQFDLKDGRVVRWTTWPGALVALDQVRSHRRPLPVYPVEVQGDKILLNPGKEPVAG
jgi:3-phenylpropionate/trans-cinnamate dioxygenase ferredoxin subunit